jgi:hypothetical protein
MDNILDSINLSAPKGNFISIVLEDFYDDIITSVNEDLNIYESSDVICDNDEEYLVDCFVEVCMDNPNDMEKKILAEMVLYLKLLLKIYLKLFLMRQKRKLKKNLN